MMYVTPDAYLHEYQASLKDKFGLELSTVRISQIFQGLGMSRKKVLV
jgi:hypothetical protein